jgi:hypothetical protein
MNRLRRTDEFASNQPPEKSGLKRDGPLFLSPAPAKAAGDERTFFDHRNVDAGSLALEIGSFRPFLPSRFPY